MSAQVQLQPIRRPIGNTVIIVVLAFTVGAVAAVTIGSMVGSSSRVETTSPAALWDSGRLDAMQGRQLAESVETPVRWDAGMLEAMQGRQLAEATEGPLERSAVSDSPVVYDSWMGEASRSLIGEFSRGQR
jgi:hypothetical protein